VGRRPASTNLGLENTQVELDQRGFAQVDSKMRTADEHILAIGDVAGEPMLAHKASHEGKVAVEALLGKPVEFDKAAIPAVVFTDPEIAWAGLTESEAQREGREYEVAAYPWAASGRAQAIGRTDGLTKWLVDPATSRVIGCGMVGAGAGELIAEAVVAIEMGAVVRDIADSIHAHPTMSETLMNAGEAYFGTATEIYKPKRS
jgi:dihydrolipoamide dehydrogenase